MDDPLRRHGGFADLVGYELSEWKEGFAALTLTVADKHMNRSGVMHGGVLTTLLDTVCGYAGTYTPDPAKPRRAFTLALTTQFISTTRPGARLTATARKAGGGRQIYFSTGEVRDDTGTLIGRGDGTYKYRSDSIAPPAP